MAPDARPRPSAADLCGVVGPVVFAVGVALQDLLRPGADPVGRFVSELSLGPSGWEQIAVFVVSGGLVAVFGLGLLRRARRGTGALVTLIGLALLASGPVVTDPSSPGTPATSHGVVHGLLGAVVFGLAPVTCLVEQCRRRGGARGRSARWALTAAVLLVTGIVVLKTAQTPGTALFADRGLVQRAVLALLMAWLLTLAVDGGAVGGRRGPR